MKEFLNKKDQSTILVFQKPEDDMWYFKHRKKNKWLRNAPAHGPFNDMGTALLAICTHREIKFSEFSEVRR